MTEIIVYCKEAMSIVVAKMLIYFLDMWQPHLLSKLQGLWWPMVRNHYLAPYHLSVHFLASLLIVHFSSWI